MIVPNETDQHNTERKKIMKKDELKLLKMSDIQVREVDWLWYPYGLPARDTVYCVVPYRLALHKRRMQNDKPKIYNTLR